MSVREYILQFNSLARYAPTIVSKMEDQVHRFMMGLELHFLNDCMSASLQPDMDISRIQAYAQGAKDRHVMRDCLMRGDASIAQPVGSVAGLLSSVRPPGSKMVRFQFPGEPILDSKGNTASPTDRFISYLKVRKMIRKGYIYLLVRVQDVKVESPTIQSILVVNEFPDELSGLPPEREIEFPIDLLPDTHPISIPPYRKAPIELKELKEQLKDLLEKGFIRPSTSP
ncbi:uncharacterized protein [Nicotiana tomentosiformis]|uniref:uncharacterized protein n=1 Tax=Nicotiana tomentosiformis TaxID=4098 RepID=UPI00388C38A4